MALLDLHQPLFHEARESAADGFQLQAQVAADFLTRHAQHQLALRKAPRVQALHQVEQEGGQALFGAHAAQQQHHAVFAHDFAAEDFVHMRLQGWHFARERLNAVKGHDADLGVFQRNGVAGVAVAHDAVQPDDFARHLKACDLVASVFSEDAGFEEAGAYGVERREGRAVVEQRRAALDLAARGHQLVELARFSL